jgi:hypothetical protein
MPISAAVGPPQTSVTIGYRHVRRTIIEHLSLNYESLLERLSVGGTSFMNQADGLARLTKFVKAGLDGLSSNHFPCWRRLTGIAHRPESKAVVAPEPKCGICSGLAVGMLLPLCLRGSRASGADVTDVLQLWKRDWEAGKALDAEAKRFLTD